MKQRVLALIFFGVFFVLPPLALAQSGPYSSVPDGGLVPCGAISYSINDPASWMGATECNICYLTQLIQNIVNFLIMVAIPISVAMFAWSGILFFTATGNPKQIGRAKAIFKSVLIGFIISIVGWLVVQVVLQTLTNSSFYNFNSWTTLQCQILSDPNNRPRNSSISQVLSGLSVLTQPSILAPGQPAGPTPTGGVDQGAVQRAASSVELQAACVNNTGVDCTLLQAVCVAESSCNPQTQGCNSVGACGPMQIQPATACQANPSIAGCNPNGTVGSPVAVQNALNSMSLSADTAARILSSANAQCNGDLTCTMAYYNGGQGAIKPSACCSSGAAWQCQWDCGTTRSGSFQCDVNQVSQCTSNQGYQETRNYVVIVQNAKSAITAATIPTQTPGGPN